MIRTSQVWQRGMVHLCTTTTTTSLHFEHLLPIVLSLAMGVLFLYNTIILLVYKWYSCELLLQFVFIGLLKLCLRDFYMRSNRIHIYARKDTKYRDRTNEAYSLLCVWKIYFPLHNLSTLNSWMSWWQRLIRTHAFFFFLILVGKIRDGTHWCGGDVGRSCFDIFVPMWRSREGNKMGKMKWWSLVEHMVYSHIHYFLCI